MTFWITVGIAAITLASLLLHHSNSKKLQAFGDALDSIKGSLDK